MSLIGLDIGTTGCKAIIFHIDGRIAGQAAREYPIQTPHYGWAEQDAELVFSSAMSALREALNHAGGLRPVALSLSCQGEAVMPVDTAGKSMAPVILGMDTRTIAENRWLDEQFGAENLYRRTGMPMHTVNTLPKLLWFKTHRAEVWKSADQFLLYEDFFIRRLCGRAFISPCLASRTQMVDLHGGEWMEDVLERCGIEASRLATIAPAHGAVGVILPQTADQWGIPRGLMVYAGGHDQACAALGAAIYSPGKAMVSTGTAEVIEVVLERPIVHADLAAGGISVYRHVIPNRYLAMTLNHSGGLSLRWYRDQFASFELQQSHAGKGDAYDILLRDAGDSPTDLFVLPHFSGSGTPILDTKSRGAILGLTFAATKAQVAKAILEGLTFELRMNIERLRSVGIAVELLHAVGGGAKSDLWLQLKADICRLPISKPRHTEAACLGAAILAGVGHGVYADTASAVDNVLQLEKSFAPNQQNASLYEERFKRYQLIYPMLKDFYHQW
ncbi:MAG: hypothetical protein EHM72_07210 [Calditrichaeota bacterium]|nr:MAG: hypothetical protein EHM72_07210 [Calditrichota bacterium]